MTKPGLPQGTRDFNAETVRRRQYIFNSIRAIFELYGFEPLETPSMENLETLMGKYGEEGDKLIFKILNNGLDNPQKRDQLIQDFDKILEGKNMKALTERALRYDLTIPFARYVAMHRNELNFPFKRYQLQPVWRADRPQKGRYREFYQCDADVVGSHSLMNEVELTHIYSSVFEKLGIDVQIKINNRKILTALANLCGGPDQLIHITTAIDKLDKTGLEKIKEELLLKGLNPVQVAVIEKYLFIEGDNKKKIISLKELFKEDATGVQGIEELEYVLTFFPDKRSLIIDPSLARGLNYYTGIIFEVKATEVAIGSIGGGGRYDDLTGLFGVPDIPGVGISFGVDRIYDVMEELNLFPETVASGTQVLFFHLGAAESNAAFHLMQSLRSAGIRSELFHEQAKFDKQFKYAEKKNIPFVVILGSEELKTKTVQLKNLKTGVQQTISFDELPDQIPL